MNSRTIIVVLGMHRSGTSVITRGLQVLGCELGDSLMAPMAGVNERGFFEDVEITNLNERLLQVLGRAWHSLGLLSGADFENKAVKDLEDEACLLLDKKLVGAELRGVKDPRISILLPFWQKVFTRLNLSPIYLVAYRNPMSVADSLERRDDFPAVKSHLLWTMYTASALVNTKGLPRIFVDYDALMENPESQLTHISKEFGLDGCLDQAKVGQYLEFLSDDLRHSKYSEADVTISQLMPEVAKDLYRWLLSQSNGDLASSSNTELEAILPRVQELAPVVGLLNPFDTKLLAYKQESEKLKQESERLKQEEQRLLMQLAEVYASRSWRITRSLRFLAGLIRR